MANIVRLPDSYRFVKARIVGNEILVHAEPPAGGGGCRRIFVRPVNSTNVSAIEFGADQDVVDFEHYPLLGAVFVLVATRRDRGLYDLHLLGLDASRATRTIFPVSGGSKDLYPVAFMGPAADARRLAMACGEMLRGPQSTGTVRYFVFFIEPDSGAHERGPELLGAFF